MNEIAFLLQLVLLVINITAFFLVSQKENLHYKVARFILLVAVWIGIILNFGKVTVWALVLAIMPVLAVIKWDGFFGLRSKNDNG